jgi:MoaA/NifB/PqqE/SkfB family radical SAM enzyme
MIKYYKLFLGNLDNNNCKYELPFKKDNPSLNSLIKEINQIKNYRRIELFGGEPTIRKDLIKILDSLKKNKINYIKIITNARMFSYKPFIDKIVLKNVRIFEIKIYGSNPKIFNKLTNDNNSFEQTMNGINNLIAIKNKSLLLKKKIFIIIKIIVSKDNIYDLLSIIKKIVKFGFVDRIIISIIDYNLIFDEFKNIINDSIDYSINNNIWIIVENIPFCLMNNYIQHVSYLYYENYSLFKDQLVCKNCFFNNFCFGSNKIFFMNNIKYIKPILKNKIAQDIEEFGEI